MLWLVDTLPSAELARVLVTMWAIWWARRRAIHDNQFQSPLSTHTFVNKFLAELEMIPEKRAHSRDLHATSGDQHVFSGRTNETPAQGGWRPPECHDVKMNVDGGLSKTGERAASAVFCSDKSGNYLGASAVVFEGLFDPTILETHACNEALAVIATDRSN